MIEKIDSGNSHLTYEEQLKVFKAIQNITQGDQRMNKVMACDYLGVCRATFDNYVRDGFIPKGIKEDGFKELSWYRSDLDNYLHTYGKKQK